MRKARYAETKSKASLTLAASQIKKARFLGPFLLLPPN